MPTDRDNQMLLRGLLHADGAANTANQAKLKAAMEAAGLPAVTGAVANLISNPLLKEARDQVAKAVAPDAGATPAKTGCVPYTQVFGSQQEAEEAAADYRLEGCSATVTPAPGNRWVVVAICCD